MKEILSQLCRIEIFTTLLILAAVFALNLYGCSETPAGKDSGIVNPSVPGSTLPAELVGSWSAGTLSNVNFYDPQTGVWGSPSGVGVYYKFTVDGYYEKGVLVQSNLYGCTTTIHSFSQGTVTLEGNKIVFHPVYARIKSEDNCTPSNNYDKEDQLIEETLFWELGTDEFGKSALWLNYENGTPAAFYRI